jgi:HSP20 family protein
MFGPGVWRFGRLMDPYAEMSRLRSEMNKLFSGAAHPFTQAYPAVNIWVDEQEAIVTVELAGIDPENLDISVQGDNLTLSGARDQETLQENEAYHRKERNGSRFARTLQLPFRIDADGIDARYDKGILMITAPRTAEDKPRKIAIKAA